MKIYRRSKRHDEIWTLPINRAALFLSLEDTFSRHDQTHHHFGQSWRWGLQSCQTQRTVCEREESSVMPNTSALLQTVRAVEGSYAPYKPSALLTTRILSTYGAYVSFGALCVMVRTIHMLDWYWSYLFLTMISYIRHKAKRAHSNSSISCSISHEPKQACHKCHIPCCIIWKVKQVLCKSIIYLVLATQCSIFPDRRS